MIHSESSFTKKAWLVLRRIATRSRLTPTAYVKTVSVDSGIPSSVRLARYLHAFDELRHPEALGRLHSRRRHGHEAVGFDSRCNPSTSLLSSRITTINRWLVEHGYDTTKLWADIDDIIIKVLISAHSVLKHNYRACFPHHYRGSACFEILGFDILLDRKLKPHVLEVRLFARGAARDLHLHAQVNHSPSFTTDSKLDREIKDALIYDTILLLNMPAADKRRFIEEEKRRVRERLFQKVNKKDNKFREEQEDLAQQWQKEIEKWENEHMGNYRRIYPIPEVTEAYDKLFLQSGTLYSETAASKARSEMAK